MLQDIEEILLERLPVERHFKLKPHSSIRIAGALLPSKAGQESSTARVKHC